jgi:endonuclease YncB( thermonuclease family)
MHVRGGDTLEVGEMAVRLQRLAAPEREEPGSSAATNAMFEMVDGQTLRCELNGERTQIGAWGSAT